MHNSFKNKYGLNAYNRNPEDLFEYASTNGLSNIEINLSHKNFSLKKYSPKRIEMLSTLSKQHNINLSLHIPHYINISEVINPLRNSDINYLLKCVKLAYELEATHITLHAGKFYWFPLESWMRKKALKRFVNSIRKVLDTCEELDVIIALENVVPIPSGSDYFLLGDNIEDFNYIFSNIDSDSLGFCLDTGHANIGEGVLNYLNNFKQKLVCVHYHDNKGNNDEHLPIGEGNIDWISFTQLLKKTKYAGPIISECHNIEAYKSAKILESYFTNH
jgi:sugar phosphate isomerase/epimerase